jgi:hypothetical protein
VAGKSDAAVAFGVKRRFLSRSDVRFWAGGVKQKIWENFLKGKVQGFYTHSLPLSESGLRVTGKRA